MFTKKNLFALLLIASSLGFVSCSDDKHDTDGPVITLNAPGNEDSFPLGSAIFIDAQLSDESGIGSYKIDIHWGGGHSHTRSASPGSTTDELEKWSYTAGENNLKGQNNIHINLTTDIIPLNAESGHYHLGIIAIDVHGNESRNYIEIEIE